MSGGGGGSNTVEKQNIPAEFQPIAKEYADSVLYRSRMSQPVYTGQRLAAVNPWQTASLNMTAQRALNGSPVMNSAQDEAQKTLMGGYLTANGGSNPYQGLLSGGSNPYAGSNPYIDNAIQSAQNDTIRAYQTGTAAQLDKAAAQANAFGNSGYQQAVGQNQYALGQNLANISNGMRMQDYITQQNLAESGLNRGLQAQMGNAQLAEGALGRGLTLYNNERARQIQGLLFAPQLAQADYTDATMLGQAGDLSRQLSQEQLDQQRSLWNEYALMPYRNIDMLGNAIGVGTGVGGSQVSPYATNPTMAAVGGGLAGAAAGAYTGAQIGSGYPGYGTIIGGIIGAGMGYMGAK